MSQPPRDQSDVQKRIETSLGGAQVFIKRLALIVGPLMALTFLAYTVWLVATVNAPEFDGDAIQIDFVAFWAAAKLALAGDALWAFDADTLRAAQSLPSSAPPGDLLWLYPPGWMVAILPLGLLPFSAAYILFSVVTYLAFAAALRPLTAPMPGATALVLAGPAVLMILTLGNNSLLWTAGLVGALAALDRGRTVLAGCLIAALTLKPQLGLLVPFALAAGGHWRAMVWATAGALAILALSTAAMGLEYWRHFFAAMGLMSKLMQTDLVRFDRMMTWYAFARLGGAGHGLALPIQLLVTSACALSIVWIWRRPVSADLKSAALCIAIPLATPYAFHYEMTLTLVAALFLVRDGFGATRTERLWLLALWLGPVPGLALLNHLPPVIYAAPLLTATLGLCLSRARRTRLTGPG